MRLQIPVVFCFMMLTMPVMGMAQEATTVPQEAATVSAEEPPQTATLQERLMPESTVKLMAPAQDTITAEESQIAQPAMQSGCCSIYIIAPIVLIVGGLIVGGSGGDTMVAMGAATAFVFWVLPALM